MTGYTNAAENEEYRDPTKKLLLCLFVPFYITAAMLGLFYMQEKVKMIKDRKCHLQ